MVSWLRNMGGPLLPYGPAMAIAALTTAGVYFLGRRLFDPKRPPRDHAGHDPKRSGPPPSLPTFHPLETAGSIPNRRTTPRRGGNSVQVLLRLDPNQGPSAGWVLDRSSGGLRLLVDRPVAIETTLQVRPDSDKALAWTDAVVRTCREEGDQYELGLQFLSKPAWGYMMQFG